MTNYDGFVNVPLSRGNMDRYYHRVSIRRALTKNLPSLHGTLLDAGCGQMPYRSYVLNHSAVTKYVGLDIETAINYSDQVKPDVTWDGHNMPFEDNSFDCVIATEVLEHVPDTYNYLKEIYRILKPTGTLFFTTPFLWPLHEIPHDEYRFTPFAMKRLLGEANFVGIDMEALGGWNASLAQMLGLWLRRSPMRPYRRKVLSALLFPVYRYLVNNEKQTTFDHNMITGISGKAVKK